jgi:hypothetical protein
MIGGFRNAVAFAAGESRAALVEREWRFEAILLTAITAVAGLAYVAWRAPVFNWSGQSDEWFYLGFFVNFDFLFAHYGFTYYASRLPWIIVGRILYAIFPPVVAFFVMHAAFFLAGALAVYLLFRRYYDRTVALVAFAALVTNVVYFVAHATDYVDGAVITLLLLALLLAVPRATGRRAWLSLAAAGFAFAAAVGTHLTAGPIGAGLVLVWASVRLNSGIWRRRALEDAVAFAVGGLVLFAAVGAYSQSQGGHTFFMQPQLNALGELNLQSYRAVGWAWLVREPKVFVVPALLVALALVRPRRPFSRSDRLVLGSAAYGVYLSVLAVIWEHSGAAVLESPFAFSMFTPGTILLLGAVMQRLQVGGHGHARLSAIGLATVLVAALPNVIVYEGGPSSFMLSGWGALVVLGVGIVTVVAIAARTRAPSRVAATALAALAAVSATNLAAAASRSTKPELVSLNRGSFAARHQDMRSALDLVHFMRRSGLQDAPFAFWVQDSGTSRAMISMYLYMWPTAGRRLPEVDAEFRQRFVYLHPYHLVLLCPSGCDAASQALARAGYRTQRGISATMGTGAATVHVQVLNVPENQVRGPYDKYARFYAVGQTSLAVSPPGGSVVSTWDLSRGTPTGWTGASIGRITAARGATFRTGSQEWEYELASTRIPLQRGTYAAYLRGTVAFGGLDLGVLDATESRWLNQSLYWFRQVGYSSSWMRVRFRVDHSMSVRLILSNWVPSVQPSRWSLDELRLVRLS